MKGYCNNNNKMFPMNSTEKIMINEGAGVTLTRGRHQIQHEISLENYKWQKKAHNHTQTFKTTSTHMQRINTSATVNLECKPWWFP